MVARGWSAGSPERRDGRLAGGAAGPVSVVVADERAPERLVEFGVGSVKFVSGMREPVVDALVEKMADAELDEALRSTLVRDDD